MDLGNGSFSNFLAVSETSLLSGVFISHRHHDHLADLVSLFHFMKFVPGAKVDKLPLLATAVTYEALCNLTGLALAEVFDFRKIDVNSKILLGDLELTFCETDHVDGTLGIKITESDGRTIVYSADSAYCDSLVALAQNADILLAESTWIERPRWSSRGIHMDALEVGELGEAAGVARLVITHVAYPNDPNQARQVASTKYSGEILIANDFDVIEV
ncbi:unnamed protein product [Acidithrix sp. C25]|nr:unnamed protein product [Acidithrix sp. C25]